MLIENSFDYEIFKKSNAPVFYLKKKQNFCCRDWLSIGYVGVFQTTRILKSNSKVYIMSNFNREICIVDELNSFKNKSLNCTKEQL